MMKIKEGTTIVAPTEERIKKLEAYSKINYPDSFIRFLNEYNGGIPITNSFIVNNHEYVIERFLCISDNPKVSKLGDYDISIVLSQIDERLTANPELIGDELIPIAALLAGDFVCLDFRDKKIPTISIWLHEESDAFAPITENIANSFEKFISMLTE